MEYVSHIGQDRWVSEVTGGLRGGYFVDFGAFDGLTISNTYVLEHKLRWAGICVEANPRFYVDLCAVRSAVCVNVALWPESRQVVNLLDAHGLSSIDVFASDDMMAESRRAATSRVVSVETLNPTELLDRYFAPNLIEYLSLDIEGAELTVLQHLDLARYRVALITVEHNHHVTRRDSVRAHLADYGYEHVEVRNEDWFYHRGHLSELPLGVSAVDPVESAEGILGDFRIRE